MYIVQKYADGSITVTNSKTHRSIIAYLSYNEDTFLKYGGIFPKYDTYLHIYTSDNIYRTKNNLSRPRMRCNCMRSEFIEYFDYDIELDFDPEEVEFIVSGRYKNKYSGELCYVEHHECVFELLN